MRTLLELNRVRKEFGGLRPLRIAALRLGEAQRQAIVGIDAPGAETLMNLVTGAHLPDEGTIRVFDRETSSITDSDDWLRHLERVGMVSVRAVLIDELTLAQNLAMAFTLSVDPIPDAVLGDVRRLAVEAGVPLDHLDRPLRAVSAEGRARTHLARALAADPALLLLDHANALTTAADAPAFGRDIARVAAGRKMAVLAATADELFAGAVAQKVFALDAVTGHLSSRSGWRQWFQ